MFRRHLCKTKCDSGDKLMVDLLVRKSFGKMVRWQKSNDRAKMVDILSNQLSNHNDLIKQTSKATDNFNLLVCRLVPVN